MREIFNRALYYATCSNHTHIYTHYWTHLP
jgi:hypothetical protein